MAQSLKASFKNPPGSARPKVYWWWLNGNTDPVRLKEELQAIKKAGLGGVDIFEIGLPPASDPNHVVPAGPAFMSKESLEAIKLAIDEAGKLDLEVGLGLASSWNAGGSWVTPQQAAKTLYYARIKILGAELQTIKLPFPTITPDKQGKPRPIVYRSDGKPAYYEDVAVLALPAGVTSALDTTKILNLTAFFDPNTETLSWKAPAGDWEIYRYVCSNSGEQLIRPSQNSAGPIIDHFDSTATRMHLTYFIDRLKPLVGDFRKSALKYLYLASYEAKEFTWTPTLPAAFKKLNGYDLYKFLPAIFNKGWYQPEVAERFQYDMDKAFSELMINNHYRKAKEICNSNGLKIISESGGPGHLHHIPVETLKALGSLDIPRGEYWYNRTFFMEADKDSLVDMIWLVKEIAAASHIYKRGLVEEESFTSYWDWQEGPFNLKPLADRAFCEGMNRLVIHGFPHNPTGTGFPGIAYFAGTHFNDKQVWWPNIRPFTDYLGRVSHLLQKASFVSDVLYYYGEKVPNLIPPKNTRFVVGPGYDYEIVNTEILLKELTVENGDLVLPGVGRYKVLTIGNEETTNPDVLKKLKWLAEKGAIIVGQQPKGAAGLHQQPEANQQVQALATPLWTNERFVKNTRTTGKIYANTSPLEVLKALGIPADVDYTGQKADQRHTPIDYIHYQYQGQSFYFIRNTTDQWVSQLCSFRQAGQTPELWDPVSGDVISVPTYTRAGQVTKVPISLPPYGSYFVVFSDQTAASPARPVAARGANPSTMTFTQQGIQFVGSQSQAQVLDGPWQLTFPRNWGAPESATFPSLQSWSKAADNGIRYFSGIATYHKTMEVKRPAAGDRMLLDLGELAEVADVWLNDKPLGITWTTPHQFDVTDVIKNGKNTLRIEVANTWSNRLTGDALTGATFTHTNITMANKNLTPWGQVPLKKSGLLGPVVLKTVKVIR